VDDDFVVFKLDNLAVKGDPNPGPRHSPSLLTPEHVVPNPAAPFGFAFIVDAETVAYQLCSELPVNT
jgi:trehalose 6-phosphate synthase/phosphatase